MGLEPTRYCYHKILSLARLPVPTLPHLFILLSPLFSPTTNIIIAPVPGFVNSFLEIYEKNFSFSRTLHLTFSAKQRSGEKRCRLTV